MKKQPASKSYFFDKGYKDIAKVMKKTWSFAFKPIVSEAKRVKGVFAENVLTGIFTLLCDIVVFSIVTIALVSAVSVFSVLFFAFLVIVGALVYLGFSGLYLVDGIFRGVKRIASHCPTCQEKFGLPSYQCPKCKALHTSLRPSVYGILKRKCNCGMKLPTTFFNGRQKLNAVCPVCNTNIKDGGQHVEIMIPVVGGPNAGKTCFINMAITQLEKTAPQNKLTFSYSPIKFDDYMANKQSMAHGICPTKTNDRRLHYYQFYLTPQGEKIKNLISLCDVAGEAYGSSDDIGKQIGYKYANAFLMVVDPLSVTKFREELKKTTNLSRYAGSDKSMDEVLDVLINTLENMHCLTSKNMIKTDVVVVFTKLDVPTLENKIGAKAVQAYMHQNPNATKLEAQNKVCEAFLLENEESNFLNSLKSKFKSVQFFACSALGHEANGKTFTPVGVEEPVLFLIDKVSKSIDLKNKWGKRI